MKSGKEGREIKCNLNKLKQAIQCVEIKVTKIYCQKCLLSFQNKRPVALKQLVSKIHFLIYNKIQSMQLKQGNFGQKLQELKSRKTTFFSLFNLFPTLCEELIRFKIQEELKRFKRQRYQLDKRRQLYDATTYLQ